MHKKLLLLAIFTLTIFSVSAQYAEIHGFVYDKETGEPIIFTNVYFEGTTIGDATNLDGLYTISRVKPGTYTLVCTYIGYEKYTIKVNLKKNGITNKNIYLIPKAIELQEVKITERKIVRQTEVKVSKIKVTPSEIAKLPSIGATPELAQYIKILPGIVSTGDKGGQIYIRGGTPIQNKVLLDGMTIYNPFHSIGMYSVFDIDIIKNMDIYTGGFDAEYGDRISAVMDISSIDGNKKRLEGKIGISPFTATFNMNGPIKKMIDNSGSATFVLSVRNSFLNKTAPVLYDYADSEGMPYSFTDLFGKLNFSTPEGSKISFSGFNFQDKVDFKNITQYNWKSRGFGTRFLLVPSASSTIVEGNFSFSNYRIDQQEADNKPRYSAINGFEGGMKFSYYLGKDLLRYGIEFSGLQTQYQFYNAVNRKIGGENETQNTTNIAAFVKYKKIINKLIITPSFRIHRYGDLQETSFEPRFGLKYNWTKNFRLKAAGGYYSQSFISTFSDRDVVNYFYGFLLAPDEIPDEFDGKTITSNLQKSRHIIGGIEFDFREHSIFNVETYYKFFNQMTNINRNKIFDNNEHFADEPYYLKGDYIVEKGNAYGINFHYTYEQKQFYFWFVYDLSYVDRFTINKYGEIEKYTPNWDRRHNVQILGNVSLGDNKNPFEISLRWNYGTGFPFTQTQGFFEYLNFSSGIDEDYTSTNGDLQVLYSDQLNGGRLPQYHRLDFSVKKSFNFDKHKKLELIFSVTNVYNRNNIFYYNRFNNKSVYQLPIIPSFGATYSF